MTTKVPSNYILMHEIADFLLGANCENISEDYLLGDNEIKLQELLSEKDIILKANEKEGGAIFKEAIELEKKIDFIDEYLKGLDRKLEIHLQVREHFYGILRQYGGMGAINTLLLAVDDNLHSFAVTSFYESNAEFDKACINSEGFVIETTENNSQPLLHTGHIILKKKDLESLQARILDELLERKAQFEMTVEDWKKIKVSYSVRAKKLVEYEDLPNFSDENKRIIMMARDQYSNLHESNKGHGNEENSFLFNLNKV